MYAIWRDFIGQLTSYLLMMGKNSAVDDRRRRIFGYFFIFLAPTVRLPLFKCVTYTHTHTEKWTHLYIYR